MSNQACTVENINEGSWNPLEPGAPVAPSTPKRSFLGHASIYGLGAMALQGASMILIPLYTRYLTPAEYGILEMVSRIGEIFNICLLANGIRLAAFTFFCQASSEKERRETGSTLLIAPVFVLGAGMLVSSIVLPYLDRIAGITDVRLAFLAVVLVVLEAIVELPLILMQARLESVKYVVATICMFCFRVTLAVIAVAGFGWGVWGVLGSSITTSAVFGIFFTWREVSLSGFHPNMKKLREVFRFILPFVPVGLCGMVLHNGDRFFLMHFGGADQVGIYSLGYKFVSAITMLSTAPLCLVWNAQMYRSFERPDAVHLVGRASTRILTAYVFATMGLCILDNDIIGLLAPASYFSALNVVMPVALAYFFWTFSNLMDAPLWVRRRSDLKSWIIFGSTIVMVALYVLLIPPYGSIGAAFATLGGLATHCAITYVVARRVFPVRYEFGRISAMLLSAILLTAAAHLVRDGWTTLPFKLTCWLGWPLLLWKLGVVSPAEKVLVYDLLRQARSRFNFVLSKVKTNSADT